MKKALLSVFLAFLVFGIAINSPLILAQETLTDPGVTPDSFLWGLDRAMEQISLLFTTSPSSKATKGLNIANERLAEIKVMIEENKLEAAERAKENHGKNLLKVKESIEEIEEDNSTDEIKKVIEIEKELEDHDDEVDQVFGELKIRIRVEGELTQAQQDLIDSILASLEGQNGEVRIEIKNKKDKTKIKIKIETGKSDDEIEDDLEKLEIESGLFRIKIRADIVGSQTEVKIGKRFFTTNTDRNAIIQEIIEMFALDKETADLMLKIEEEDESEELEERFKVKVKVKDGITKVEVKLKFILNATDRESILDSIVSRSVLTADQIENSMKFKVKDDDDDKDDELEIEVEIEDGIAEVEIELNGKEFKFSLETIDKDVIINKIIERTGLTREQIESVIEFDIDDKDKNKKTLPTGPGNCIAVFDPVCGIDGKTYSNSCFAGLENVEVACKGKCPCDDEKDENKITIELTVESDSGESGKAKLVEENKQVTVTMDMDGAPKDVSQPAHIHLGSCPGIGGIAYPLTNILNGESVTTINVTLDQLKSELPLAINVHKSVNEASVYVSCGNLVF